MFGCPRILALVVCLTLIPIAVSICQHHRSSFRPCASATYSACGVDAEHLFRIPVPKANGQLLLANMRYPYRDLRRSGSEAWSESTYIPTVHSSSMVLPVLLKMSPQLRVPDR